MGPRPGQSPHGPGGESSPLPCVLHAPATVDGGGTVTFELRPPASPDSQRGWLVTLAAWDVVGTPALAGLIEGWDGLRIGASPAHRVEGWHWPEQPVRIWVPWGAARISVVNSAAGGNSARVQVQAVAVPLADAPSQLGRYLWGDGGAQAVGLAEVSWQVPAGATAYRIAWEDPAAAALTVLERPTGGVGASAVYFEAAPDASRRWVELAGDGPVSGTGRTVSLQAAAIGPSTWRIEWRYDLAQPAQS